MIKIKVNTLKSDEIRVQHETVSKYFTIIIKLSEICNRNGYMPVKELGDVELKI